MNVLCFALIFDICLLQHHFVQTKGHRLKIMDNTGKTGGNHIPLIIFHYETTQVQNNEAVIFKQFDL